MNAAHADQVISDDLIVQGSVCVGFDCVNNESFAFDTIILKENNLRIFFNDTSTGTFPSNDWGIEINSSVSGGNSYFSIVDRTANQTLFRLCAVADTACTNIIPGSTGDPQIAVNTANIATNTANIASLGNQVASHSTILADHETRISGLEKSVGSIAQQTNINRDGVAIAIALGAGVTLLPGQRGTVGLNYGNFAGASAVGLNGGFRLNDLFVLNGALGYGFGTSSLGGRVGLQVAW